MQHTLLITYHLTKKVMKSALMLLFISPITSWSNSFQSHAIWKVRAVCIQVTSAGTTELAADVCPGTSPPVWKGQGRGKPSWSYMIDTPDPTEANTLFCHIPQRSLVGVSRYWAALWMHRAVQQTDLPSKKNNPKTKTKRSRRTAARGRNTNACNQELNGFHSFMHISHLVSLHIQVLEHCLPVFW